LNKKQEKGGFMFHSEKGYKKFLFWQKADELVCQIYLISKNFPREELFGLTSQVRRAATSVPTNIAEAMGRQHRNETRQFLNIALGSLSETEYLLSLSFRLGFLNKEEYDLLETLRSQVGSALWNFYKNYR